MRNTGYRFFILLTFAWAVLLPFLWVFRISIDFDLSPNVAFLAYRPELVAAAPSAVLLAGAWRLKSWAVPGLFVGALGMALLKVTLGGAPTDAWKLGGFLFICLALRLSFLLKQGRQSRMPAPDSALCITRFPMQKPEPWATIISYWQRYGLPIRQGVTSGSIRSFEEKYQVALPIYFAEYLMAVDGTGINESDENILSFLSLSEMRPVHEVLNDSGGGVYPDRFAYPNCFVFADYMMSCWLYAIQITSDPESLGPVYRVTASEVPGQMEAASFREFMTRYAGNPASVL